MGRNEKVEGVSFLSKLALIHEYLNGVEAHDDEEMNGSRLSGCQEKRRKRMK